MQDFIHGQKILKQITSFDVNIFRPAYGKIKKSQILKLKSTIATQKASIINWSLMAGDFDQQITSEQCFSNLQRIKSGDIVVMHDNDKARKHLEYCLPKFLEFCKERSFSLNKLNR